ncbi:MAG: HD domain-containing protein [Deltaproteobacteria bacterium]|nr:HD domain-containing protein [Deltaproteobacteria bacterium]
MSRGGRRKKQAPPAEGAVPVSDRERDLGRILERKIQELSVLQSINEALEKLDGSEQLFRNICEIARHLCGAKTAAYYVYDRDNDALVQHKAVPPEAGIARKTVLRLPPKLRRRVLGERVPFVVDNAADLSAMFAGPVGGERTPRSALVAPFYVRDEYFGVLVLEDKDSGGAYEADDVTYLRMLFKKAGITIENQALYETIYSNLVSTLHSLVSTIEAKDPYTRFHSERVTRLSVLIGKEMGCDEAALETLRFAGSLHDIGKIGVPDTILQKPSGLTKEEFDAIKMHPIVGERILEPLGMLPEEQSIIRHHHERWDGRGYPDGLAGTDIPFLVRIVSLADSYDAMTSDRAYRKGMDHAVAMEEIVRTAGAQFDPNVVLAMRSICKRISNIKMHLGSDKILQMGGVLH